MSSTLLVSRDAMNLAKPFGPVFWGVVLNLMCAPLFCTIDAPIMPSVSGLGMTLVQALSYCRTASRDRILVKLSALAMMVFDIVSTGLILAVFWTDLILDFGDAAQFQGTSPTIGAECTISAFIALFQTCWDTGKCDPLRPRKFRHALLNVIPLIDFLTQGCLATIGFAFGLGCATFMVLDPTTPHYNIKFQLTFGTAKGANAVCDIIATIMMCLYLKGSKTGISSTERLLDALTMIFMNRGALVMVVQVFTFVMFFAFQNPQYWLAPHLLLTKVYVNTFFAILNSRSYLREKHLGTDFSSSGGSGTLGSSHASSGGLEKYQAREKQAFSATITKDILVRSDSTINIA
ncbi:hypothetical protein B0H13DRAFT_2376576 [Mycena leptocephala]|nr:hypothetical protein B0H13DRAFT_2376576 [Mycena leptocephala]